MGASSRNKKATRRATQPSSIATWPTPSRGPRSDRSAQISTDTQFADTSWRSALCWQKDTVQTQCCSARGRGHAPAIKDTVQTQCCSARGRGHAPAIKDTVQTQCCSARGRGHAPVKRYCANTLLLSAGAGARARAGNRRYCANTVLLSATASALTGQRYCANVVLLCATLSALACKEDTVQTLCCSARETQHCPARLRALSAKKRLCKCSAVVRDQERSCACPV